MGDMLFVSYLQDYYQPSPFGNIVGRAYVVGVNAATGDQVWRRCLDDCILGICLKYVEQSGTVCAVFPWDMDEPGGELEEFDALTGQPVSHQVFEMRVMNM